MAGTAGHSVDILDRTMNEAEETIYSRTKTPWQAGYLTPADK